MCVSSVSFLGLRVGLDVWQQSLCFGFNPHLILFMVCVLKFALLHLVSSCPLIELQAKTSIIFLCGIVSILRLNGNPLYRDTTFCLFICLGTLGCFHLWTAVSSDPMNTRVQIFKSPPSVLLYIPRRTIGGSCDFSGLIFKEEKWLRKFPN